MYLNTLINWVNIKEKLQTKTSYGALLIIHVH
jgi:hypothetical protein